MRTKSIKKRLKEYFFINPTAKLRVRQIEREVNIPLPSAITYAKELEKENILQSTIIGGMRLYTTNKSSQEFLIQKKLFNIYQLHITGLLEYVKKEYNSPTVVLFGSYSRGEDIESSDIDLYIETPSKKTIDLAKYHKTLHRKIQVFKYKSIRDIENKELANNIINGVTLLGFIEVL
jgi:predicted nucleotidyltransferase